MKHHVIPEYVFELIMGKFPHNGKWMRFHQWQPWCNSFYLNNCRIRLVETDDEKRMGFEDVGRWSYQPSVVLNLTPLLFDIAKRKLDAFFKDKQGVYIDIRPPGRIEYEISPAMDFFANLLGGAGTSIQYGETLKSHKRGERKYQIFPVGVFGRDEEGYVNWWLEEMMGFFERAGVFVPPKLENGAKVFTLEIEIFSNLIWHYPRKYEDILAERIKERLGEQFGISTILRSASPAQKPYKRPSLVLEIQVIKRPKENKWKPPFKKKKFAKSTLSKMCEQSLKGTSM